VEERADLRQRPRGHVLAVSDTRGR
jgi:hypothetical protein